MNFWEDCSAPEQTRRGILQFFSWSRSSTSFLLHPVPPNKEPHPIWGSTKQNRTLARHTVL